MRCDLLPDEGLARRVKAARALGGFSTAADLAKAIDHDGFGLGPIRLIEAGRRGIRFDEAALIETACGVAGGFVAGVQPLPEFTPSERLEAKVDALMRHLGMDPEKFA